MLSFVSEDQFFDCYKNMRANWTSHRETLFSEDHYVPQHQNFAQLQAAGHR